MDLPWFFHGFDTHQDPVLSPKKLDPDLRSSASSFFVDKPSIWIHFPSIFFGDTRPGDVKIAIENDHLK